MASSLTSRCFKNVCRMNPWTRLASHVHSDGLWWRVRSHPTRVFSTAVISENVEQKRGSLPHIIQTDNVPVYLYAHPDDVEPQAIEQLIKLANSPLPVGYVSAMPDVHLGKGATIGTVFASADYVCPNTVGVDIGCGMCAVPIEGLHKEDLSHDQLVRIQTLIKERIPTGFERHKIALPTAKMTLDEISHEIPPTPYLLKLIFNSNAAVQLGTLGGGNHFLEVVYDESGQVWAMLHSGSRNVGNQTAMHHDKVAAQTGFPDPQGLNYMRIDSQEGQDYLKDMEWNQKYAFHNRRLMMELLIDCIEEVAHKTPDMNKIINRHHNYCSCQRCKYTDPASGLQVERDLWVTRKGATSAMKGEFGIIPGSMGVGSFIVKGRGNPMSWSSCSHGAGRRMSRTKAFSQISQEDFEASMAGIVCDMNEHLRDEAPTAYKDLTRVMANQEDLVDVAHRLLPLINVKGFDTKSKSGYRGKKKNKKQ